MRRVLPALLSVGLTAALVAVAAPSQAAEGTDVNYISRLGTGSCAPLTKTITGTIQGADRRYVNASIAMDLQNGAGQAIDGHGCRNTGYGVRVHVNYTVGPSGVPLTADLSSATVTPELTWSVTVPANVAKVYIEVYPQRSTSKPQYGISDSSHYGMTERPGLRLNGAVTTVPLVLPTTDCHTPGAVGTLTGRFLVNGKPAVGIRVSAFSQAQQSGDPLIQGPLGMGIWNGRSSTYTIKMLASGKGKGQPYVLLARLANNRTKTVAMIPFRKPQQAGIQACKTTRFDIKF